MRYRALGAGTPVLLIACLACGCGERIASVHTETPLRAEPNSAASQTAVLAEDAWVSVVDDDDGWLHVRTETVEGYLPECLATVVKKRKAKKFQTHTAEAAAAYGRYGDTDDPAAQQTELGAIIEKYADTKYYAPALVGRFQVEVATAQGNPIQTLATLQKACEPQLPDDAMEMAANWALENGRIEDAIKVLSREESAQVWVGVNKTALRYAPTKDSKRLASSSYGVRVEIQRRFGAWRLVRTGEKVGWVHQSTLSTDPPLSLRREYAVAGAGLAVTSVRFRQKGKHFTGELVNHNGVELGLKGSVSGDNVHFKCPRRHGRRCTFKGVWQDGVIVGELVYVQRGIFKNHVRLTPL